MGDKKSAAHGGKGKRLAAINKPATKKHAGHSIEGTVTVDRRGHTDRRSAPDRRIHNVPPTVERRTLERRVKVNRRRQIDPTTCERDYTADEIEFMNAMDEYKRRNGRMFPTCSEVLEVVRSLGYLKRTSADPVAAPLAVDLFAGVAAASVAGG